MTDNWDNLDDVAMRTLYEGEGTKLSYEEWFAGRLINHSMGIKDAVIFTDTQTERDKTLKDTVLKGTKTRTTQKNTDKLKKSTVLSKEPMTATEVNDRMDEAYGVSPMVDALPNPDTLNKMKDVADSVVKPARIEPKLPILSANTKPEDITPAMFGLTPKQLQFCWEYIKDFNGVRSVRDAGYGCKTVNSQSTQANDNLLKPTIQHCMAQLMKLRRDRVSRKPSASELAKSADLVLERAAQLANYSVDDFITIGTDGLPFYDFSTATPEQMRGMTGLKIKQGIETEFDDDGEPIQKTVYDIEAKGNSIKATELLMRHHGLLTERIEIDDKRDLDPKDVARRLAFLLQKAKAEKD